MSKKENAARLKGKRFVELPRQIGLGTPTLQETDGGNFKFVRGRIDVIYWIEGAKYALEISMDDEETLIAISTHRMYPENGSWLHSRTGGRYFAFNKSRDAEFQEIIDKIKELDIFAPYKDIDISKLIVPHIKTTIDTPEQILRELLPDEDSIASEFGPPAAKQLAIGGAGRTAGKKRVTGPTKSTTVTLPEEFAEDLRAVLDAEGLSSGLFISEALFDHPKIAEARRKRLIASKSAELKALKAK